MKESYYFPHDYNARNDEKILKLWQSKGTSGYGIYWAVIEMLYEAGGVMRLDCDCIAFALHTQCDEVKAVLHDFGLFEINDIEFTSKRVQENLETRNTKSVNARKSAYKRWVRCERNANALPTQCKGNAIKERKGKEIKGKEKKLYMDCVYLTDTECSELKKLFGDTGCLDRIKSLNDYVMSKKKKYNSHYHTILTWERKNNGQIGRSKQPTTGEEKKPSKYAGIECEIINTDDPGTTETI